MEKKREYTRKRKREEMKDDDNKDAKRRKQKEIRNKKKIEKQMLLDEIESLKRRLEEEKKKVKELKKQIKEMEEKNQILIEHLDLQAVVGDADEEKEEEIEEEEEEEKEDERLEIDEKTQIFLKNPLHLKMVTRNDENFFAKLVNEVHSAWENTTWRGSERKMNTWPESPQNSKLPSSLPCFGWSIITLYRSLASCSIFILEPSHGS